MTTDRTTDDYDAKLDSFLAKSTRDWLEVTRVTLASEEGYRALAAPLPVELETRQPTPKYAEDECREVAMKH